MNIFHFLLTPTVPTPLNCQNKTNNCNDTTQFPYSSLLQGVQCLENLTFCVGEGPKSWFKITPSIPNQNSHDLLLSFLTLLSLSIYFLSLWIIGSWFLRVFVGKAHKSSLENWMSSDQRFSFKDKPSPRTSSERPRPQKEIASLLVSIP